MLVVDVTKILSKAEIYKLIEEKKWDTDHYVTVKNKSNNFMKVSKYDSAGNKTSEECVSLRYNDDVTRHDGKVIVRRENWKPERNFPDEFMIEITIHYVLTMLADPEWLLCVDFSSKKSTNKKNITVLTNIRKKMISTFQSKSAPNDYNQLSVYYRALVDNPSNQTPENTIVMPKIENAAKISELLDIMNSFTGKDPLTTTTLKSAINQPKHLSRVHYLYVLNSNITGYFYSVKLNGEKCVFIAEGRKIYLLFETYVRELKLAGDKSSPPSETFIADCELIGNDIYIVDVIAFQNEHISIYPFEERYGFFTQFAEKFKQLEELKLRGDKKFVAFERDPKTLESMKALDKKNSQNDGYILYSPVGSYSSMDIYKIKPTEKNTIDFYVKRCPDNLRQKYTHSKSSDSNPRDSNSKDSDHIYFLFVAIKPYYIEPLGLRKFDDYNAVITRATDYKSGDNIPIQFSPASHPKAYIWHSDKEGLDDTVAEFGYDSKAATFVLDRMRPDKVGTWGNSFLTAEMQWLDMINPLTLPFICGTEESDSYFQKKDEDDIYKEINDVHRAFRGKLYSTHMSGIEKLVDYAGGRGADLGNWRTASIQNVLVVDQDPDAIAELVRRRTSLVQTSHGNAPVRPHVYALLKDLNLPAATIMPAIEKYGLLPFDGATCNFAIHYMIPNIDEFATLAHQTIRSGAKFFFTALHGGRIHELLLKTGGKFELYEGERLKFKIVAKYPLNAGKSPKNYSKIDVLLPFSDGKYYEEYLVDVDDIIKQFEKKGFKHVSSVDVDTKDLKSDVDRQYAALTIGVVFEKN